MTKETLNAGCGRRGEQAAEWFARLQGEDAAGEDWLAFETWLAVPGARGAYERLEALWVALEDDAPAIRTALDAPATAAPRRELPRRAAERRPTRRTWLAAAGALAASLVAGVFVVANWPTPAEPQQTFRTAAGEVRDIALADGTRINSTAPRRSAYGSPGRTAGADGRRGGHLRRGA
jgi:transmembrane sensor